MYYIDEDALISCWVTTCNLNEWQQVLKKGM